MLTLDSISEPTQRERERELKYWANKWTHKSYEMSTLTDQVTTSYCYNSLHLILCHFSSFLITNMYYSTLCILDLFIYLGVGFDCRLLYFPVHYISYFVLCRLKFYLVSQLFFFKWQIHYLKLVELILLKTLKTVEITIPSFLKFLMSNIKSIINISLTIEPYTIQSF